MHNRFERSGDDPQRKQSGNIPRQLSLPRVSVRDEKEKIQYCTGCGVGILFKTHYRGYVRVLISAKPQGRYVCSYPSDLGSVGFEFTLDFKPATSESNTSLSE